MIIILFSIGIFLFIVLGEHKLKQYIDKNIRLGEKKGFCKNKIIFTKSYNQGAALRILEKQQEILKVITAGILSLLGFFFLRILFVEGRKELKLGFALILGGGVSNLWDRFSFGHVIDYITFSKNGNFNLQKKIIFNLSDFCIFGGSILLFVSLNKQK